MTQFIERIKLSRLNNGRWFQFMTQFETTVVNNGVETLKYDGLWDKFMEWYNLAEMALKYQRASEFTEALKDLDEKRDMIFSSLNGLVKSYLKDFENERVKAAKEINPVFENHGNIAKMDRNMKTAMIGSLISDLQNKHDAELNVLNLKDYVAELDNANKAFDEKWLEKGVEVAAEKLEHTMRKCRFELGRVYDDLICRTEVFMIYFGVDIWQVFVEQWNVLVREYKELINRSAAFRHCE